MYHIKGEEIKSSDTSKQAHIQIPYHYVHNLPDILGIIKECYGSKQ